MRPSYYASVSGVSLTAATAKTVFEIVAAANRPIRIIGFHTGMKSVTASDTPASLLIETDDTGATTGTGTGVTEVAWGPGGNPGATLKHTLTVEPSGFTADRQYEWLVPVNGPYTEYFPLADELWLPSASLTRVRLTSPQAQTANCWLKWID